MTESGGMRIVAVFVHRVMKVQRGETARAFGGVAAVMRKCGQQLAHPRICKALMFVALLREILCGLKEFA